jgi:hypothetical protein
MIPFFGKLLFSFIFIILNLYLFKNDTIFLLALTMTIITMSTLKPFGAIADMVGWVEA